MGQPVNNQRFLETTRGRILGLLRCETRTVEELAQALDLTDNAVRAHLSTLERDGMVRSAGVRRGTGSRQALDGLRAAAGGGDGVLARLPAGAGRAAGGGGGPAAGRADGGDPGGDGAPARPAAPAAGHGEPGGQAPGGGGCAQRVGGAASLEEGGAAGAVIRGCGCPLASAVARRPEACRAFEALVSEVVGAPVRQCCRQGDRPSCCFEIAAAG